MLQLLMDDIFRSKGNIKGRIILNAATLNNTIPKIMIPLSKTNPPTINKPIQTKILIRKVIKYLLYSF